jgi:hypothetical protein
MTPLLPFAILYFSIEYRCMVSLGFVAWWVGLEFHSPSGGCCEPLNLRPQPFSFVRRKTRARATVLLESHVTHKLRVSQQP